MLGEEQDVLWAFTQRGKREGHNGEPMVEVVPETSGARSFGQVLVGRGDHLDIDALGACAAEATYRPFLDRLQELCLEGLGQQRHLVEKQRSPVRGLKEPGLRLPGVGERAALETEQLGFEQAVGNGRAAHIDEWAVAPRAFTVDQPREQTLACARFALQQYRWEPMRVLSSGEQLLNLLAHYCDRATHPEQLFHRDHSAVSYIRSAPPATGEYSPPIRAFSEAMPIVFSATGLWRSSCR